MSFRHTFITEYLYKSNLKEELNRIQKTLEEFGYVHWQGDERYGYFHGVIKDLNGHDTKAEEESIVKKLEGLGVRIKIIIE